MTSLVSAPTQSVIPFLHALASTGGSDLHCKVGSAPRVRVDGRLRKLQVPELTPRDTEAMLEEVLPLVGRDVGATVGRELVSFVGSEIAGQILAEIGTSLANRWNRGSRTGYKVVRLKFENGKLTGAYEDFVTGFVLSDARIWGRPVGVTVARDGSLFITDDGAGTIWRVSKVK